MIFLDSDGRFPTSLPELHLRRTIGLKKDEYSLDRKSASKAEVMSLLESAGFSRYNPYYIVPQGRVSLVSPEMCLDIDDSLPKITHLTNMSDKERLNLLKDVAGTKVYEQKRAESTRIMEETGERACTSAKQQLSTLQITSETKLGNFSNI